MKENSRNGLIGAALIGLGCGLTAVGMAMVIPACANWSLGLMGDAVKKGREGLNSSVGSAAALAGQVTGVAQRKFEEASKTARERAAKAAGVVENAARYVREHAS
jgi:GTP-dependent phosphoenolpyruvate carboxykinase